MNSFVLWLTGLPSSGKSDLADQLSVELERLGLCPETIHSGRLRRTPLGRSFGFSRVDRQQNILRHAIAAQLLLHNQVIPIVSAVSPYAEDRQKIRSELNGFVEIYVSTPAEECQKRDQTGNWARAMSGEIENFTGVSAPYEKPESPEVEVDLSQHSLTEASAAIIRYLHQNNFLCSTEAPPSEIDELRSKLEQFGYI